MARAPKFAEGGIIQGPGGPDGDSLPILLEPGHPPYLLPRQVADHGRLLAILNEAAMIEAEHRRSRRRSRAVLAAVFALIIANGVLALTGAC